LIKIVPVRLPDLPKLAWAASFDFGEETLWVIHGAAVECRDQWLVEGIWDGPFDQADFRHSASFFGSGIRIDGDQIYFVPSSALLDRLLYYVHAGRLVVSNSLVLLMSVSGASMDGGHNYHKESNAVLKGIHTYDATFKVSHPLIQHFSHVYHNNIIVSKDGDISIRPKLRRTYTLNSFHDYHDQMMQILRAVHANYTDPGRSVRLDAFSTISTGYDSAAVSTLVRSLGVKQCFNSRRSNSALPPWLFGEKTLDDATHIARTLGMKIVPLDPRASRVTEDELYFYAAGSAGAETIFASMAEYVSRHCEAAVVFTGHPGGTIWGKRLDPEDVDGDIKRSDMSGQVLSEARLKSGFINAPVPFIMALETEAIHQISNSQDMEPWRLGTSYDRPIPRRIVEQAGVRREAFGQYKKSVWVSPTLPRNAALRKQFLRFLRAKGIRHARAFTRFDRLSYFAFRMLAYMRQFARSKSFTLDPRFADLLRTRKRFLRKTIDFPHLLHLWAVDALAQQATEMLLASNVDSRWKLGLSRRQPN
jgi:hypothetical protein